MRYWIKLNNILLIVFVVLSILSLIGGYYTKGICIWFSFLTLLIWPILAGNLLLMLMQLFARKKRKSLIPLIAILLHTDYLLAMYQIPHSASIKKTDGTLFTLVTYNVSNMYTDRHFVLREAAAYLQILDADVICLQEAPGPDYYHPDSVQKAFYYMPYQYITHRNDHLKLMILSRYPLRQVTSYYYRQSPNLTLSADIELPGRTIRLFNNHLQTTSVNQFRGRIQDSDNSWTSRLKGIAVFLSSLQQNMCLRADQADYLYHQIRLSPYLVLVCGDFNDIPASYAYHRISQLLTDGFRDCGSGYGYTFRQLYKLWRIDYIFYSNEFTGITYTSPDTPFSDHKVVVWSGKI